MEHLRAMGVVLLKEVTDNVRDRRAMLLALVYPLMAPLLIGVLINMFSGISGGADDDAEKAKPALAVYGGDRAPALIAFLQGRGYSILPVTGDPKEMVRTGKADNIIAVSKNFHEKYDAKQPAEVFVLLDSSRLRGLSALKRSMTLLGDFNREIGQKRLVEAGVDPALAAPLTVSSVNISESTNITDFFLYMIPPFIIFTIFMGGIYLAVDSTSGERERGSLEPLLINPVERWALMMGKFAAALLFTALAVFIHLLAFKGAFFWAAGTESSFYRALSPTVMISLFFVALPLMFFAVGVQVIIATLTRSYKEAQTYLGLMPLVPALPGLILVFSPLKAQSWMMAIPIFAQTVVFGDLVRGDVSSALDIALSMVITLGFASVLALIAAWFYEREQVIFGG
ncbi:MAG: ABC transporter permease [Rhodospirillales bacterium]|nr:ABC transporter permease [Rhodospirillales bacterium]